MSDKVIWQSVRNIIDTVNALEAVGDVIGNSIMQQFQDKVITDEKWEAQVDNGWIEPLWVRHFAFWSSNRAKARVTSWISIGFQLTSDASELEWSHGQRAKLLIGYGVGEEGNFSYGTDFPNAGGEAEDMDDDGVAERYNSDGFRWIGERCEDWFFSVPLDALTNEADVQRLVVDPLDYLIAGKSSQEALGAIRDALCLPPKHQEALAEA